MSWNEAAVLVVLYFGILALACWFCYESGRSKAVNVWRQEVSDLRQELTRAHFDKLRAQGVNVHRLARAMAAFEGMDPDAQAADYFLAPGGHKNSEACWQLYKEEAEKICGLMQKGV